MSINTRQMEIALSRYFNCRLNLIVPNVSWGLRDLGHECDMLVIRPSGFAVEVEIKISRGDLIKDAKKWHQHKSELIRQLWFAIPEPLQHCVKFIPEHAGILVARKHEEHWIGIDVLRHSPVNKSARSLTPEEILKVSSLGCMRIWSLKSVLQKYAEKRM